MTDKLLELIAPHSCCGCNNVGKILCDNCQQIVCEEPYQRCIACTAPAIQGVCEKCQPLVAYSRAWCVGERKDVLQTTIDAYKFRHARGASHVLVSLLHATAPRFPTGTHVVPIPTVEKHIRQRGYDQCRILAKQFAQHRNLPYSPVLYRKNNAVQRGTSRDTRIKQAADAFAVRGSVNAATPYIIVDDVVTTGATLNAAAQCLKRAGASEIWCVVLAKAVNDKTIDDTAAIW